MKWIVRAPRDLEKILRRLPIEIGRLFEAFVTDLENEGPFPNGWQIGPLSGNWKGFYKAKLKRDYRVIYSYKSNIVTVIIEKISDRKNVYRRP